MEILLAFSLLFVAGVLSVSIVKNRSVEEATRTCKRFIADMLKGFLTQPVIPQYYPVMVGHDGFRIVAQLVDNAFKKVSLNFAVCFYTMNQLVHNDTVILYRFSIKRKLDSLDDKSLLDLLQKQSEEVLTKYMYDFDCHLSAEMLTAVYLMDNDLYVAYARTEEGISRIDSLKKLAREKYITEKVESNEFTTDWNEE